MGKAVVVSFYGADTDPTIVAYQKKVFEKFPGDYVHQQLVGGGFYVKDNVTYGHGANIDSYIRGSDADIFIFMDVDCIPLTPDTIPWLIEQASKGLLAGEIQRSNHIKNGAHLYAGSPCFAISRETYNKIGQPSCEPTARGDTVEELTYKCEEHGVALALAWPICSDTQQWDLVDGKRYGIGTTFEHGIYHQFCVRHGNGQRFISKCKEVLGEKESTLVLTAGVGYSQEVKGVFVKNLRDVGFSGDIEILDWAAVPGVPFLTQRVKAYYEYLQSVADKGYSTIVVVDLRDVLFQGNPANIVHGDLDVFLEDARMKIKDCPYNSRWIRDGWGDAGLAQIGDHSISCAGTVIGKPQNVLEYYKKMWEMCLQGYGHVVDQGIHNYLLHTGQLNARIVGNEDGDVYTVGYVNGIIVKGHKVYNRAGKVPVIVHQFDRHIRQL